jgi:uncharacterized membrane protein
MLQIKQIFIATGVFLLMDFIWLGFIAKNFYIQHMGSFLKISNGSISANYLAAAIVYFALIGGIIVFVLPKAGADPLLALYWGAVFGFVCYATYDFTNLAVIPNWSVLVSIVDVIWGALICGVTSYAAIYWK